MAVAVFLTAMALLSLVGAVPVPNTQEITLQVPSELLKEHTLVLTLSPLPSTGKSLGKGEASGAAASAEASPDEGPTKPEGETTIEPNTTTSANKTTSGTPSDFLKTTVAPPVILPPVAKGDDDTSEVIVQIPNRNKCPEGHAPDTNGICRELFKPTLSAAKSLDNSVVPELLPQAVDIQD